MIIYYAHTVKTYYKFTYNDLIKNGRYVLKVLNMYVVKWLKTSANSIFDVVIYYNMGIFFRYMRARVVFVVFV